MATNVNNYEGGKKMGLLNDLMGKSKKVIGAGTLALSLAACGTIPTMRPTIPSTERDASVVINKLAAYKTGLELLNVMAKGQECKVGIKFPSYGQYTLALEDAIMKDNKNDIRKAKKDLNSYLIGTAHSYTPETLAAFAMNCGVQMVNSDRMRRYKSALQGDAVATAIWGTVLGYHTGKSATSNNSGGGITPPNPFGSGSGSGGPSL